MKLKSLNNILSLSALGEKFTNLQNCLQEGDTLCQVPGKGERIHLASALEKPIIYITKDSYSALFAYQEFRGFYGDEVCLFQPNDDLLLYRKSFQKSLAGDRVKALYKFAKGSCKVLVTSPIALLQYVPKKKRVLDYVTVLKTNEDIDIYKLIDILVNLGYEREEVCEEKNTFAVHGDIVDIFLSYMTMPIRISFFGDTIENIKTYDVETLLSTGSMDEVELYPNNDLLFTHEEMEKAIQLAKKDIQSMQVDAATRAEQILSDLALHSTCNQQAQWLIPYLIKSLDTLYDYLPKDGIIVFDEPESVKNLIVNYDKETKSRVADLSKVGEVTLRHLNCVLSLDELEKQLENQRKLAFSNLKSSNTLVKPKHFVSVDAGKLNNYILHYDVLHDDLISFLRNGSMVVLCQPTKDKAKTLADSLSKEDIPCSFVEGELDKKPGIFIVVEDIIEGFNYPKQKLAIIGADNIVKRTHNTTTKRDKKSVFVMPQVGDYVVHETYGIGRCLGPKRVKTGNIEQDYVLIEYRNGGLLYLPVNQMDKISRYSGSEITPKLNSLSGKDFVDLKAKVKKSLKAMAFNLLDLYAARQNKQGYKYKEDDYAMQEFESAFEYEPTPDQLDAIRDIKEDMEKGVIMDRLLCGDVGYGKTEVALRAIFKTILDGKQAAFLCPTTILAQQHYETAKERFAPFGIGIELISRLKTNKEIKASLERIQSGKSQVVIATHRLLSKDVQFKDLGLMVLDEEQRFGVEHKEKLKVLKNNLNVLTLSATPIPRTLNMSLIGVRDISVLETPPVNRIPVQTSVTELTDALLEDAIKREIARGGQVFILFNNVERIARFASDVQSLVPEAKVIYAHGQMNAEELENKVSSFYEKKANVLVCTTIIENGIDIPDANTLIVCNADKLGLSQLYQLRGRVGRSNKMAFAYFTIDANQVLTDTALKRLNAIMDYTELGSGFKIAMRDLEIRGAGNILGREQHGHIEKVGYDMYCKLLQESINELRGIENHTSNCLIEPEVDAFLDYDYVSDDNARLKIFRDIIDTHTQEDVDVLIKRLQESFGEVPKELINLINVGFTKNLAEEIGIEKVVVNKRNTYCQFDSPDFITNEKIMMAIADLGNKVSITSDAKPKLEFNFGNISNVDKLTEVRKFLLKASL